jgi:hypothetical protein
MIPRLPTELHCVIAAHLSEISRCSDPFPIRLANKAFADIGVTPLFSSLRFRASRHSLPRMRNTISRTLVRDIKEPNFVSRLDGRGFEHIMTRGYDYRLDISAEELVNYTIFSSLVEGFVGAGPPITSL